MNWRRLLVAALGIGVFGLAAVVVLVPGAESLLPVDAAVEALGLDYLLVAILGVVAVLVTLLILAMRALGGQDQATPPDPESIETVPRFGADVDAVVEDGLGLRNRLLGDGGEAVRERFRETAVRTVARVDNCDHASARRRVADGTWTDDPEAAAFLAEDGAGAGTMRMRVRAALAGESLFQRGARRTASAIVDLAEGSDASAYRSLGSRRETSARPGATSDGREGPDGHEGEPGSGRSAPSGVLQ